MKTVKNIIISRSRNPYFIGINSAMEQDIMKKQEICSRNPYFIGINSAINWISNNIDEIIKSQSLFYWN